MKVRTHCMPLRYGFVIINFWSDSQLALWNASASMGNAIGSFICGAMTDRFGYRNSQLMGCTFSVATVFLQVFAVNREMILVGKLLNGIVSKMAGCFLTSSPWGCL